ncbi:hypothetical protein LCI18_012158 [Fusarium solani-melongenae]|uniref:Uncharacterized protein n=1 Tax=Fusarium solani subsp. cucurbitae TaxID=2747967 RepID=A0ACD3ZMA6_FUSSC|nr:hypothetical protein LCI18_012158 [Fusarium solani-melongenae]
MSTKSTYLVPLGKNGPLVPQLGFGLMGFDEERFALLDHAHEVGSTFWDSADLYGDCEELIGKWFKRTGKRDDIFLATKFGFVKGSKTFELNTSYEYAKQACAESLRLLDVDYIDLCKSACAGHGIHGRLTLADYVHHPNPETPIEQTMRALKELQDEGKIKHIGLSAVTSTTLRRAIKIAPVAAVQIGYSPFELEAEGAEGTHIIQTCRELGVAVVAAMPLGRGLLTTNFVEGTAAGDEKDVRWKSIPRFGEENREKNMRTVGQFKALADKKGVTTAQLALAWLLKQGNDVIPIPGTKRVKYFDENWASLDIELSDEEEAEIRRFVQQADVAGGARPPAFEDWDFRDTKEEV